MPRPLLRIAAFTAAGITALAATLGGIGAAAVAALPFAAGLVPLELSHVVVTDGRRQVEMVGMAHVAVPGFYREVAGIVAARRKAGWLVFYEEVRPDVDDRGAALAEVLRTLGADWTPGGNQHPYELMAPMLGEDLVLQDNRAILGAPGPELRNVDLTLSQLLKALAASPPAPDDSGLDIAGARRMFDAAPPWVQRRVRAAFRILLAGAASSELARTHLPEAVMATREKLVAEAILSEPGRNILILYGQAHLDGIRKRLAAGGRGWSLVSEDRLRAF